MSDLRLPFWVLLDEAGENPPSAFTTTGKLEDFLDAHRTARWKMSHVPDREALILAVQGEHAAWIRNLQADSEVRIRRHGRWRSGTASVHPVTDADVARFSAYARFGLKLAGQDPVLVRVALR